MTTRMGRQFLLLAAAFNMNALAGARAVVCGGMTTGSVHAFAMCVCVRKLRAFLAVAASGNADAAHHD